MSSIQDFVPMQKLHETPHSNVYKVRRLSDQQVYALKKIKMGNLSKQAKEKAFAEVQSVASLNSRYVLSVKEAFLDQRLNFLCVLMEYVEDGAIQKTLLARRKGLNYLPENEIWIAAHDILMGLHALHEKELLHKDINCSNVFKQGPTYKLGNLHLSKLKLPYNRSYTPFYTSPEVWRDEPYDCKSDIWSFGCIIYEMASFAPPFLANDRDQLFRKVQSDPIPPIPSHYSQELWALIEICLRKDPAQRYSAIQLLRSELMFAISKRYSEPENFHKECADLLDTVKYSMDLKGMRKVNMIGVSPDAKLFRDKSNVMSTRGYSQSSNRLHPTNRSSHGPNFGINISSYINEKARIHTQLGDNNQLFKGPNSKQLQLMKEKSYSPSSEIRLGKQHGDDRIKEKPKVELCYTKGSSLKKSRIQNYLQKKLHSHPHEMGRSDLASSRKSRQGIDQWYTKMLNSQNKSRTGTTQFSPT